MSATTPPPDEPSDEHHAAVDLDLSGLACPLPVLRVRKALASAAPGDSFVVRVTDPMAQVDLPHLCQSTGDGLSEPIADGDGWLFRVTRHSAD